MDEIELQLCLNVDSAASRSMPPPPCLSPRSAYKSNDQDEKYKQPHAAPWHHIQRGKRFAGSFGNGSDDGDDDGEGAVAFSVSDSFKCRDDCDGKNDRRESEPQPGPGRYLRLPPRKRVRTSFLFEPRRLIKSGGEKGNDAGETATVNIDKTGNLKRASASLPEFGCIVEGPQDLPRTENDLSTQNADMEAHMDVDDGDDNGDTEPNAVDPISLTRDPVFHPPQPPFVHFPKGAYMPAFLDSLSSSRADQARRTRRFSIYEDPEDMDIDGAGYFESSWYLSPEDDKENAEEESNNQSQHPHPHPHEHDHDHDNEQDQHHGHSLPFAEQESYNSSPATEQRTYHDNTTALSHHNPITSARAGRRNSNETSSTSLSEVSRRLASIERDIGQNDVHQFTISNDTSTSTPSRTDIPARTMPSPSSLSATEVSLHALPSLTPGD